MTEYANAPAAITIAAGDRIRFVNNGELDHNAVSGADPVADGRWASPEIAPGDSWTVTFEQPGNYDYFCSLHPTLMPGTVTVES